MTDLKINYWTDLVSYDDAIDILSTDWRISKGVVIQGNNARPLVERSSDADLSAEKHGAWLCCVADAYCAYASILAHRATLAVAT